MEIWKKIKDYPDYEVSNLGKVKSLKYEKERILKPGTDSNDYYIVRLSKKCVQKTRFVHHLVAEAFLNHNDFGKVLVINHINFIRNDNRVENLEIVTSRENGNRKHIKSTSVYVGVHWYKKSKKWQAQIRIKGKLKHLGLFVNEIDAHNAYQNKLLSLNI